MNASITRLKDSLAAYRRPHGIQGYWSGCRCVPCRSAHSGRTLELRRERANGRPSNAIVSAAPAREHLRKLSRSSVGVQAVAEVTGLNVRKLKDVRAGRRLNIRAECVRKILSVTKDALSDGAQIPIGPSRRFVHLLTRAGFTQQELGRRLGIRGRFSLRSRKYITAKRAMEIERIYNRMILGD